MRKFIVIAILLACAFGGNSWAQRRVNLRNTQDSLSYAAGVLLGYAMFNEGFPIDAGALNTTILQNALSARVSGEGLLMSDDEAMEYVSENTPDPAEVYADNKAAGERFMRDNSTKPGVLETESGLQYKIVSAGDGEVGGPRPYDDIWIKYTGKTIDGKVFDDEYAGDEEKTWPADKIDGLSEGLTMMSPGSKYIFFIPADMAWEEGTGGGNVKPYSAVVYEVEMINWEPDDDYYSESVDDDDDFVSDYPVTGKTVLLDSRAAGDYGAVALPEAELDSKAMGYGDLDVYSSFAYKNFKILITLDRIVVTDRNNKELINGWIDNKDSNYDYYSANVYESGSGSRPSFLVIDMGYLSDDYWGSAVYMIEGDNISSVGILDVAEEINGDKMQVNPVLYLYDSPDGVRFVFDTPDLVFNPGKKKMGFSGDDLYYLFDGSRLTEEGPATILSFFRQRKMTEQARRKFDDLVYHIDFGDMNRDGEEDFVLFRYDNEKIYVCICKDGKWTDTYIFDIPYDYTIDRDKRVVTNGEILLRKNGREPHKWTLDANNKLVEKE